MAGYWHMPTAADCEIDATGHEYLKPTGKNLGRVWREDTCRRFPGFLRPNG